MLQILGDTVTATFSAPFSVEAYNIFLQSKKLPEYNLEYDWESDSYTVKAPARFANVFGLEAPVIDRGWLSFSEHLFDFQKFTARIALDSKRYAVWWLTGCVSGDTIIHSPDGDERIDVLTEIGKPIRVYSLNDKGETVIADATCPFKKGIDNIYEFKLKSGKSISVTSNHRFLTRSGWTFAGLLIPGDSIAISSAFPVQSNSELSLSGLPVDVPCSTETTEDSTDHCCPSRRRYDQPLRDVRDIGLSSFPLQDDVHEPCFEQHSDDLDNKQEHIHHHPCIHRLSKPDSNCQDNSQLAVSGHCSFSSTKERSRLTLRISQQFDGRSTPHRQAEQSHLQTDREISYGQTSLPSSNQSFCFECQNDALFVEQGPMSIQDGLQSDRSLDLIHTNLESDQCKHQYGFFSQVSCNTSFLKALYYEEIVSVNLTCVAEYFDLHVPVYENYSANGIWNHNTGKTHLQWELARQITHRTGGKVLMIVPLNIISQTLQIGEKYFGITDCVQLTSRDHLRSWCTDKKQGIAIVNPDKFIPKKDESEIISECHGLHGVLLDEASLLASGGGKIKWSLIKSCKGVEYKYTFTATPARNCIMDYASQGSFLEKLRNENDILWTYFQRDKNGEWDIRPHAEMAFYRFMSGWSMYLINPKHYGFDDYLKDLPEPEFIEHHILMTEEQRKLVAIQPDKSGQLNLFGKNRDKLTLQERSAYSQMAKGFRYNETGADFINSNKPDFIAELVKQEASAGLQPIVWTIFDEESRILEDKLKDSGLKIGTLHGKISKEKRPAIIDAFRNGDLDVLISKASLLGFGLNFQNCASMIFSGFDDSFEKQFQAVRRSYRYGQKRSVRVHIPYIPELEGVVWKNVCQKQERYDMETRIMEDHYREAMKHLLN